MWLLHLASVVLRYLARASVHTGQQMHWYIHVHVYIFVAMLAAGGRRVC